MRQKRLDALRDKTLYDEDTVLPAVPLWWHTLDATRAQSEISHLGSAKNRDAMHGKSDAELTDSMKIFRWGLERGRPAPGEIGVAPEWFYKGNGTILRAPGEALLVPPYAEDGADIIERYARAAETHIAEHPADWLWMYRKWKYKKPLYT